MPELSSSPIMLIVVAILAYLAGSVPFGLIVARLTGLPDPRTIGSGNIGATNVLRTGSKPAALATVLLDGTKGLIAVVVGRVIAGEDAAQVAALAAFLGHIFPIWLNFKGGKGVATLLGALVGLAPLLGLIAMGAWLFTFFVFRYSSLSALLAALVTPPVAFLIGMREMIVLLLVMALILAWKHKANIERLREGTEPLVDWSKK
ncbi:MAG: glycerol-3-phosphate 1-O-acyltransferase PlsY [Silicimonas sp.]|nr:glycerol-3-phosphate 1-O-acyltransferase PlsY [Silicimonas sp.]